MDEFEPIFHGWYTLGHGQNDSILGTTAYRRALNGLILDPLHVAILFKLKQPNLIW